MKEEKSERGRVILRRLKLRSKDKSEVLKVNPVKKKRKGWKFVS